MVPAEVPGFRGAPHDGPKPPPLRAPRTRSTTGARWRWNPRRPRLWLLALGLHGSLAGQPAAPGPSLAPDALPSPPTVTRPNPPPVPAGSLGLVTLDPLRRTLRFPASVNQRAGVVEYVVVTTRGKTHESVFRTEAEPQHVHLAALLLDARPPSTPVFPADLAAPLPGVPVRVAVLWTRDGQEFRRPIEEFVVTTNRGNPLAPGPWIYNGSYVSRGTFVAQQEGSIVSLQIDPSALVNNPRPGRENDDLHHVHEAVLPPSEVPLIIEMTFELPPSTNTANTPTAPAPPAHAAPSTPPRLPPEPVSP